MISDLGPVSFAAFGASIEIETGPDEFLRQDSFWRVREIYERFLGVHSIPNTGLAIDVGAGFGAFAIPFAIAHPDWAVLCFEPDEIAFHALSMNIRRYNLANVVPVPTAIGGSREMANDAFAAMRSLDPDRIAALAGPVQFYQAAHRRGFLSTGEKPDWRTDAQQVTYPAVHPVVLAAVQPDLLKFTAPGVEQQILSAFADAMPPYVIGESWMPPRAETVFKSSQNAPYLYVPVAGSRMVLSREPDGHGRHCGLDVVVAMYNSREWIVECVEGILGDGARDVRAIVVDDGSTDGCGDLATQHFMSDPRVRVVRKPNGGCASARNFGRHHSNTTHIAFVDFDDLPDPALFPTLLELARYSGSPVTQGGFDLLYDEPDGRRFEPSYETADHAEVERRWLHNLNYYTLPAAELIASQPAIWRRVYRRDFLDGRNIWFPEHIRAFDDQIFQMLSLHYAGSILCTDDVKYHYRQHALQDIRQGDERCFYSLEMYRIALKRAVTDGWEDFAPFVQSFANTINWTVDTMRPDLKPSFLRGAAELWFQIKCVFGDGPFRGSDVGTIASGELAALVKDVEARFPDARQSYGWAYLDTVEMHPELLRARANLGSTGQG